MKFSENAKPRNTRYAVKELASVLGGKSWRRRIVRLQINAVVGSIMTLGDSGDRFAFTREYKTPRDVQQVAFRCCRSAIFSGNIDEI